MFAKLESLEKRYEELEQNMADPAVLSDPEQYRKIAKARADVEPVVLAFREYRDLQKQLEENKELLSDEDHEIREMAQGRNSPHREGACLNASTSCASCCCRPIRWMKRTPCSKCAPGTGGEEAALFAADLFHMYCRYAELQHWKVEIISEMPTDSGGYKEVIALVSGKRVYSRLRYESGTHRVQRVPATESQGRIHTSAATVAVMPEAEEVDVNLRPEDLRIGRVPRIPARAASTSTRRNRLCASRTFPRASWSRAKTNVPQHKNKARAMKVLASRILQAEQGKAARIRSRGTSFSGGFRRPFGTHPHLTTFRRAA